MSLSTDDPSRIFVFREKHGDRFFLADTPERIKEFCWDLLKERHGEGEDGWDCPSENIKCLNDEKRELVLPLWPRAKLGDLPSEALRNQYRSEWDEYDKQIKVWDDGIVFWQRVQVCLDTQDKKLAVKLVFELRDAEYEGFEIENLENLETT